MKPDAYKAVSECRIRTGPLASNDSYGNNGAFLIQAPYSSKDKKMAVIVSDGDGWDHVSVSLEDRCPTWEEMCVVKDIFFGPEEVAMQLHPAKPDYVNCHRHCLHLWRPQNRSIPMPPTYMVGPQ